jgi:hypothetical protein
MTNVPRNGDQCVGDEGTFFRQLVKTVAHSVEFLGFVRDRTRRRYIPDFLRV